MARPESSAIGSEIQGLLLPMRIFINNVDSYVGRALCADLRKVLHQENRILGSLTQGSAEEVRSHQADGDLLDSLGVKRVVDRADKQKYLSDILSCSLIVYDLHSADLNDVETLIKELKVAELGHETTFVLISSVMAWANTRKQYVPLESPEEEEEGVDDEVEEVEVKKRPKELTDADLERRAWKYLETLVLSLSSKAKLRPHVIGAGILYGNGETVFNELFKAAWLTQPVHKIIAPGDNYIPCVHVRDVARLVRVVVSDASLGSYLLAVDHSRLTQAGIIQGIISQMSHSRDVPICPAEDVDSEFKEVMSLDLILEPSAPLKDPTFGWWCRDGMIANIEKAARVAKHYLHEEPPHLTYQQIIDDACAAPTKAARKLRRKVQKLVADPSKKLPLQIRTKLVQSRLLSNVCRYRGYVLEGYPTTHAEAEALFLEQVKEGEEEEEEAVEVGEPGHHDSCGCDVRGCQSFRLKFGCNVLQGVLQGRTWLHDVCLFPDRSCGNVCEVSWQLHDGTEMARQSTCDLAER
eukprot:s7660_g1.t1